MNITLRQLQAFLAVSELGSFTRAADRMRLTQSAISVLVVELERSLNLKLLDRTTRRVEMTEAGRQFGAQAAKIISDLDHAVHNAHSLSQRLHGRLTVFAPPLLAAVLLPSVIAEYRARFPGISISIVDGITDQLVSQVRAGEVDFGIGTVGSDIEDLERIALASDRMMLFCANDHPLAQLNEVPWQAMEGHKLIALTRQSGVRRLADDAARAAGLQLQPEFEVAQIITAIAMAEAGLGITVLPSIASALRGYPRLAARTLIQPCVGRVIEAVHRQGRALSPAGESFIELVRQHLSRMTAAQTVSMQIASPALMFD